MPLPIYRLRRLLALTAILFVTLVLGMYFYARSRVRDVRRDVGQRLGVEIKQTANGFQFSKSDGKRTLFTVQARDVKEFKLNGRAELHNVSIVVYGRDSSRFDRIYGDEFSYDPQTGDVAAKGDVQIDLVANPAGLASPDQSVPQELRSPIHLKTRDLVFNRESGNASTDAQIEFRTTQAYGTAVGIRYAAKSNSLTLVSKIHLVVSGPQEAVIDARRGVFTNGPRQVTLDDPRWQSEKGTMRSAEAVFLLGAENQVERVLCTGNVEMGTPMSPKVSEQPQVASPSRILGHAQRAEFLLNGKRDELRTAILTGDVHFEQSGLQAVQGDAGRLVLDFADSNQLQAVHALEGTHLAQKAGGPGDGRSSAQAQDFDLTAAGIDFTLGQGTVLQRAVTSGAARILISSLAGMGASTQALPASYGQRMAVTADKFEAQFAVANGRNRLASVYGAPNARVVSTAPGQSDRVSTSDSIRAVFLPQGGIEAVTQEGNVTYSDSQPSDRRTLAWASRARYTPPDQVLLLTGNPRVSNGPMETTANTIRINRSTGDAQADGNVKSTYSNLKDQPDGALLGSSSPIHVTAATMTAHNSPGVAQYSDNARLWQDANVIEAPSIQFDRDRRFVTAQGDSRHPVQTILVQAAKPGAQENSGPRSAKASSTNPFTISAARLTYADSDRKVHYEGGVEARGSSFTATAATVDAFLLPHKQSSTSRQSSGPGQLDHLVADGKVLIVEPGRKAQGENLVYTAADEKFVLTGGPPSIFDAEHGKITGVSLTFFRRDDRVLVEGEASTPVVTTTRVAR